MPRSYASRSQRLGKGGRRPAVQMYVNDTPVEVVRKEKQPLRLLKDENAYIWYVLAVGVEPACAEWLHLVQTNVCLAPKDEDASVHEDVGLRKVRFFMGLARVCAKAALPSYAGDYREMLLSLKDGLYKTVVSAAPNSCAMVLGDTSLGDPLSMDRPSSRAQAEATVTAAWIASMLVWSSRITKRDDDRITFRPLDEKEFDELFTLVTDKPLPVLG